MAFPESQLETWAKQGSITQSAATYKTIKSALEASEASYSNRNFEIFLQGSYGNDSNIYAESDVDVVIKYKDAFFHDLKELPDDQNVKFQNAHSDGTYTYDTFKSDVKAALTRAFGASVAPGNKAIRIKPNGSRRSADVIVAFTFRRYFRFNGFYDQHYEEGISFFRSDGLQMANYPKQHSENCTTKHQATNRNFKPMVRIFKNMRSEMVGDNLIGDGVGPSYFIEGLLYNIPNEKFSGTYSDMVLNVLMWLHTTSDRSKFVCANEQFYLLRDNCPECWPCDNGDKFIKAAIKLWNEWN